ncbi:MAG: SNF2-related protein, partial [Acidobacteriota bacterium]
MPYETAIIELKFSDTQGVQEYLRTLAILLHHQAVCRRTIDRTGQTREGLSWLDQLRLIDGQRLYSIDYRIRFESHEERLYLKSDQNHLWLQTRLLFGCQPTDLLWFQASQPLSTPLVALPVHGLGHPGLTLETLHPLIVLAFHTGKMTSASCAVAARQFSARWTPSSLGPDSLPLRSSREERLWQVDRSCTHPALWFTPAPPLAPPAIDDEWWKSLLALRKRWPDSRPALKSHLTPLLPAYSSADQWELEEMDTDAFQGSNPVAIIQPEEHRVRVAIDRQLEGKRWGRVLLHSFAHLALGHLRPGDRTSHADDLQSVINPLRHRDQLASQYARKHWIRPGWCEPESLADCSPEQKAKLGIWRILNERLGEGHLHEKARFYQSTYYQRQAATRLVDILNKYHGAILCDGVGLGKTYVATTVMVHYINTWLDQQESTSNKRITIIVPNQVVSTWQNEALPSISDFGGRSVQIRILTHHSFSDAR